MTRAVLDEAMDCFHVEVGDQIFASHLDEGDALSIATALNGIGPITAAARDVVHRAYMSPPTDVGLMDSIAKLARVLEQPATLGE